MAGSFLGGALGGFGGAALGRVLVEVGLDTRPLEAGLAKAKGEVGGASASMGATFKQFATSGAGLALAGTGIVKFGADTVRAFEESQQVAAQTQAVLKSTGGQAGVTADQVYNLAKSLSHMSGVDDEAVQTSENLLLTFRQIGSDIFPQAEKAILNMATAMNHGAVPSVDQLHSSTIQLGKALADPITGMTALRRVGVSFSESQSEVIKKLAESGHLLEAQKLILREVQKEFGGAAKAAGDTFAGQMSKLHNSLKDVEETIGANLVPVLQTLAGGLTHVFDILNRVGLPTLIKVGTELFSWTSPIGLAIHLFNGLADAAHAVTHPTELASAAMQTTGEAINLTSKEVERFRRGQERFAHQVAPDVTSALKGLLGDVGSLGTAHHDAASAAEGQNRQERELGIQESIGKEKARSSAEAQQALAQAHYSASRAARDQRLKELELAGGLLGVQAAALDVQQSHRDLASAQKAVTDLQAKGKQGTSDYRDAVASLRQQEVDSIQTQMGLSQAVEDYIKQNAQSKLTTQQATAIIDQFGRQAGLTKGELSNLESEVLAYVQALGRIPSKVTTTVNTNFVTSHSTVDNTPGGAVAAGGLLRGASGFVTQGPTVYRGRYLIGEGGNAAMFGRGSEAVLPLTESTFDRFGKAIAKHMPQGSGRSVNLTIYAHDPDTMARAVMAHMSRIEAEEGAVA